MQFLQGQIAKANEDHEKFKNSKIAIEGNLDEGILSIPRSTTDCFCIPILLIAQVVWVVVSIMGMADGNPEKLYKPRDFQGAYCGVETNWNDGPNTVVAPKASYTMNLTAIVDEIMKQTVCSTAAQKVLVYGDGSPSDSSYIAPLLTTQSERQEYLCDCCAEPCKRCNGMVNNGGDLPNPAALATVVAARMAELSGSAPSSDMFNPSKSANGDLFASNNFWEQAMSYFNQVCLPECDTSFASMNTSTDPKRQAFYKPAMDDLLYKEWMVLTMSTASNSLINPIRSVMNSAFTFDAYPMSICPYEDATYCVPMPGIAFAEVSAGADYCTFEMASEVVAGIGEAAANAFSGLGGDAMAEAFTSSIGEMAGDFSKTADSLIIVCVLAFVIGIAFLVLLRFFIGVCVWVAVAMTVFMFLIGGLFTMVRSSQCQGMGFFDTSQQMAVAVAAMAENEASNLISGTEAVSEAMDPLGDGTDYRGVQKYSIEGIHCVSWVNNTIIPRYDPTNYPNADLNQNFCRNPFDSSDINQARTIWCLTSDVNIKWQECRPIGVIQPPCLRGYAVKSEKMREVLWYASFVVWALGGIWCIVIICLRSRIALAIALNKVGAVYLAENPHTLLVPVVQCIFAAVWIFAWAYTATFLLSQVPNDYTPNGYYATYQEAYGTSSNCAFWEFGPNCTELPGACNDKWPVGDVWKDTNCTMDGPNGTAACYRCSPPRFIFDWRFAVSFFVFLWNNAFNVALGQMIIAMCVSIWFFSKDKKLGKAVPKAIGKVFRYHIGSVAFGSFIVAVVQFIRYLMKYFEKQASAQKNRVMVLILKVLQCVIWCFEKCVQFINKNAYIQIALLSKPFCTSAKAAFFLILRNAFRFGTVAVLSTGIHLIGYACIISSVMVCGYYIVRAMHPDISPALPILCYLAVGYMVAKLYLCVFGLAVDTSLQCFLVCEDMDMHGDWVPNALSGFIDQHVPGKDEEELAKQREAKAAARTPSTAEVEPGSAGAQLS